MNNVQKAGRLAQGYHEAGFHCAEAVLKAVLEVYGKENGADLIRSATAFGGGVGKSHLEICGALSGAIMAAGALFGRDEPGLNWDRPAELAAQLRQNFLVEYGSTNCGALLGKFGPQENMERCKRLSGETAAMLCTLLEKQ